MEYGLSTAPWFPDLPGSLEYPGIGRRVLLRRPAFTAFLLRRGVASPEAWQDGQTSEHAAAFCGPAPARVGGQLHWQFVLRDIPALVTGRNGRWLTVLTLILAGARNPVILSRRCCRVAGGMPIVGAENLYHQVILVDHASGTVAPLDPELIQVETTVRAASGLTRSGPAGGRCTSPS